MSQSQRTDSHRIAVLDPAQYKLIAFFDAHEDDGFWEWMNPGWEDLDESSMDVDYAYDVLNSRMDGDWGKCRVCGASHGNRYWHFFEHTGGDVIQVGSLCAIKVGLGSRAELEDYRAHNRRTMAVERGHFLFLAGSGVRNAVDFAQRLVEDYQEANNVEPRINEHGTRLLTSGAPWAVDFAASVLSYFNREAYISRKQQRILMTLPQRIEEDRERQRKYEEMKANDPDPTPVVEGRIDIAGKVLSTKWQESLYGDTLKMLVLDDRGFKVWGTVPAAIDDVERGNRVAFTASVERSDDDETFGFYKRPVKAELIIEEVETNV